MFQVEIDISPSQTQTGEYLPAQIKTLDEICDGYWSRNLEGWKPECKGLIEKTIGRLAAHNPREIKRLLNSTLVPRQRRRETNRSAGVESQRFTQGAQVFLVQEVLRAYFNEDDLLRYEKAQVFFEKWSRTRRIDLT